MERKPVSLRIYAFALAISLLVFVVGLVLGWQWGFSAVSQMKAEFDSLFAEGTAMELVGLMGNESFACPVYEREFASLFGKTERFGSRLSGLEQSYGKQDPQVMELKKEYASMQLRNYLLQKAMDERCGTRHNVILYFYSNENYSAAADEGLQIARVDREFGAFTYHFDVNVDSPVVAGLVSGYAVGVTPTLVINGEKRAGFLTARELRAILSRSD